VHLFLHPGAEDLQTVQESVAARTVRAIPRRARGSSGRFHGRARYGHRRRRLRHSTAVRDAIDAGLIPGPRLRISGNAIDILGGHEDAIGFNPAQHVLSNATYANNAEELIAVIRGQRQRRRGFAKIYETGPDTVRDGVLHTPYQYSAAELSAAVAEAARLGTKSRSTPRVNPVRCTRRRPAWPRSTTRPS